MKNLLFKTILIMLFSGLVYSQTTSIKLPTSDSTSNFRIFDSYGNKLLGLGAGGSFYLIDQGGASLNTPPVEGFGSRFMWLPSQGALRAGFVNGSQWNKENIGSYSVALGQNLSASSANSISLGRASSSSGYGSVTIGSFAFATKSNAYAFGKYVYANGESSMALGTEVSTNGHYGSVIIGDASVFDTTSSTADHQMMMRFNGGYIFYTVRNLSAGVSLLQGGNSWSSVSDSTKKENFVDADGEYFLNSLSKLKLGSWNYKKQNPKKHRHYGPMAQEIFHYFGKDKFGTIGNDTTVASADMDGIIMICLQALEKRTQKLDKKEQELAQVQNQLVNKEKEISRMKAEMKKLRSDLEQVNKVVSTINEKLKKERNNFLRTTMITK